MLHQIAEITAKIPLLFPINLVFSVGYDSQHMKLDGKFTYRRENQRTLAFNVDIREDIKKNKPKMAYSRDLPKIARQQCGIVD